MPTLAMRCISTLSVGLWSCVSASALPRRDATQRLSPALATHRLVPLTSATTCTCSKHLRHLRLWRVLEPCEYSWVACFANWGSQHCRAPHRCIPHCPPTHCCLSPAPPPDMAMCSLEAHACTAHTKPMLQHASTPAHTHTARYARLLYSSSLEGILPHERPVADPLGQAEKSHSPQCILRWALCSALMWESSPLRRCCGRMPPQAPAQPSPHCCFPPLHTT